MKLLLVEDDDLLRDMLRIMLEKMAHQVAVARNGADALEQCRLEPPDVVLTDIIMPEKEGLETIRELRRDYPEVKIIAMSGGGRVSAVDYLKIAKQMGAAVTLDKPFSGEALAAALASLAAR